MTVRGLVPINRTTAFYRSNDVSAARGCARPYAKYKINFLALVVRRAYISTCRLARKSGGSRSIFSVSVFSGAEGAKKLSNHGIATPPHRPDDRGI